MKEKYIVLLRSNKPKWLTVAMPFLKIRERQGRDGAMEADSLTLTNEIASKS